MTATARKTYRKAFLPFRPLVRSTAVVCHLSSVLYWLLTSACRGEAEGEDGTSDIGFLPLLPCGAKPGHKAAKRSEWFPDSPVADSENFLQRLVRIFYRVAQVKSDGIDAV